MTMARSDVGDRLRALRAENEMTQGQLAYRAGVTRAWVSLVESGGIDSPAGDKLERVATVLGKTSRYLLTGRDEAPPADPDLAFAELVRLARQSLGGGVVRIPIQETPAHAGEGGIEGQYALLPVEYADENVLAFRITGRCMEPVIEVGDIVIADASTAPEDGAMVVVVLDGETRVKIYNADSQTLTALDGSPALAVPPGQSMATLIVINKRAGRVRRR